MAKAINENELARRVALAEGQKLQVTVAQVKEVLRITLGLLAEEKPSAVLALLEKHVERGRS